MWCAVQELAAAALAHPGAGIAEALARAGVRLPAASSPGKRGDAGSGSVAQSRSRVRGGRAQGCGVKAFGSHTIYVGDRGEESAPAGKGGVSPYPSPKGCGGGRGSGRGEGTAVLMQVMQLNV